MAQQIIVRLVDDIDGSEAVETTKFAYKGVHYEIDLSTPNGAKFDKVMKTYIDKARRTGGRQVAGSKSKSKTAEIREWAMGEGMDIRPNGILPKAVTEAYAKAHAK